MSAAKGDEQDYPKLIRHHLLRDMSPKLQRLGPMWSWRALRSCVQYQVAGGSDSVRRRRRKRRHRTDTVE